MTGLRATLRIPFALLLAAAIFAMPARADARHPSLDRVMAQVAGHGTARCLEFGETDPVIVPGVGAVTSIVTVRGRVRPGDHVTFAPGVCDQIVAAVADPDTWLVGPYLPSTAQQFLLFTHELGHMTGMRNWRSEAVVGCWGVQHVYGVALLLGLAPEWAAVVGREAVVQYALWPARYHLRLCPLPAR